MSTYDQQITDIRDALDILSETKTQGREGYLVIRSAMFYLMGQAVKVAEVAKIHNELVAVMADPTQ